jgi:colicin import membrane protein
MLPLPGQPVPLALINATIDKKVDEYIAKQKATSSTQDISDTIAKVLQDPIGVAKALIAQAKLLEADAEAKREEAYALDPESRPLRGRPADAEEIKAEKLEERKEKRRERDRARAAEAKADKAAALIDAKVEAKLKRDAERLGAKVA